ncbi:hypothetical protein Ddc_07599 [Ditylenchus destructor]|nr:hypothetical protein Ddc_07599 [Ditylenchus destructor]
MSESGEVDSEPEVQNGHLQEASYSTPGDHLQPLHNSNPVAGNNRYNDKKPSHCKSRSRGTKRHHKRRRSSSRSSSSSTSSSSSSSSYSNSSSSSSSRGKHKHKKRSRNKRSKNHKRSRHHRRSSSSSSSSGSSSSSTSSESEGPHYSKHKSSKNGEKSDKNEKGMYVLDYLATEFKCRKGDAVAMSSVFKNNMGKVRKLLNGKSAKAHYSKSVILFQIYDVTNEGADTLPAYIRAGRTVEMHFKNRHKLVLVHPDWPCLVSAGGSGHRSYYPIEVMYFV